ncbi:hypothetical protein JRC49_03280 [Clostridiales bacterium FE2011]|nr:hypothetical protein JRC49_03280 [Clostridiales bacterium FE2011]
MEMSGYSYTASAGETADSIALDLFGDEKYAAELLCANPELALKARMAGGEEWLLPVIDIPAEGAQAAPETAPWKE